MMECQIKITYDELHAQDAYQIDKIALRSKTNIIYRKHEHRYDKYKKCRSPAWSLLFVNLHIFIFLMQTVRKKKYKLTNAHTYMHMKHLGTNSVFIIKSLELKA